MKDDFKAYLYTNGWFTCKELVQSEGGEYEEHRRFFDLNALDGHGEYEEYTILLFKSGSSSVINIDYDTFYTMHTKYLDHLGVLPIIFKGPSPSQN